MQTEAVDEFEAELLDAVGLAVEYFDEFAIGFLVVPKADHVFLAGKCGENGSLETDIHGVYFSLVEAIVEIVENIAFNHLVTALCLLGLQQGLKRSSGDGAVIECDCDLLLKRTHCNAHYSCSMLLAYLPFSGKITRILVLEVLLTFLPLHPQ